MEGREVMTTDGYDDMSEGCGASEDSYLLWRVDGRAQSTGRRYDGMRQICEWMEMCRVSLPSAISAICSPLRAKNRDMGGIGLDGSSAQAWRDWMC